MDEVTQQNAALVEQAAAASASLQEQAARLKEAVGVFKLDGMAYAVDETPLPPRENVRALPAAQAAAVRTARPKKLAAAGGGNEEWEEF
jgi:hypothetical protein